MGRGDDPATIPPTDTITRELLTDCAHSFVGMIRPYELTVQLPMRPVGGEAVQAAFKAVEAGRFADAVELLEGEAAKQPDNLDLAFNIGVAAEAAGQFETAIEHYRLVSRRTNQRDVLAVDGLDRAKKVHARLQHGP